MKILAIDYGSKRIGLAISDTTQTLARPLPFLPAESREKTVQKLKSVIEAEQAEMLLLGLPRNMDGSYGEAAEKVKEFAEHLKEAIKLPLRLVDERLSTVQAGRLLHETGYNTRQQRGKIDSSAAAVLLQSFLDCNPGNDFTL